MGIRSRLRGFVANPRGWEDVRTIQNEIRTDHGQMLLGTLSFVLQRSRSGARRYLTRNPDGLHENAIRHSVGRSHGELWVRTGKLPVVD